MSCSRRSPECGGYVRAYARPGILVTMWHNSPAVVQGEALLRDSGVPVFRTVIRRSDKVDESTFARQPLNEYSRYSSAGRDYRALVAEYLEGAGV